MTDQARKRRPWALLHLLQRRNLMVFAFDVAMAFLAVVAAFVLRLFEDVSWGFFSARPEILQMAGVFAVVAAAVYLVTGIYRHMWEYVSAKDAFNILRTATLTVAIFLPVWFWLTRLESLPRSVPVISWFVLVAFLAGPRLLYRISRDGQMRGLMRRVPNGTPVLLIGAGPEAEHFIRAVSRGPEPSVRVVGMVAAADGVGADRVGQVIHGVEILGREGDILRVMNALARRGERPEKLVLVTPTHDGAEVQRLLAAAEDAGCQLARVPPPTDLQAYDTTDLKPRPIAIEDLLGRPQARLDRVAMTNMINARRVLITGAGGSIGSELVRQISDAGPVHVTLVDNGEFNLYSIDLEIRQRHPALSCTTILADVRDADRIRDILNRERPDLVFHAAALKHVPMVETNPIEGLLTNALGTRNVAEASIAVGVAAMVLISTDKAVNPHNVMGASKRIAEIYCQAADLRHAGTRFITVRFGNVLGSAGSVVPLFQKQLEEGGPLTVTHPEVERYFMTVRESVELVLQAAALGRIRNDEGVIHVLDMGPPVKIMDLARQMIRLAGKTVGVDIDIKITGLRPGEKLKEELFHGQEPLVATDMGGILLAQPRTLDHAIVAARFTALEDACRRRDEGAAFAIVKDMVPELQRASPTVGKPHLKVIK
ncbi:MAG: polysaccharide biosynthesis protein [Proteobacteria bacterium]|nr:polysaccharide biosynthesis protein [Pseudomonadota bacterium]